MNKLPDTCREYSDQRKFAVAEEKGKKYTLKNESGFVVEKYRIDGCIAQSAGERRCDFLFLTNEQPRTAYFVELKGGDTSSALEQICDTIKFLKPDLPDYVYKARVVGHGTIPDLVKTVSYRELLSVLKHRKHFRHATNKNFSETI